MFLQSTEKPLLSEINFLIDIFTENGHNRNTLTNIATEYLRNINKPKSNDQNNNKNTIKLPWVPILGPKLRKEFKKKKIKTVFTSGVNLKSILCQNKSKLIPNSYPGVYTLNCSCNADYIGETKKKVITRTIEHQQDSIKGKWESSGAKNAMVNSIGYTQRHYQGKPDIKAEKLGSHWKL